MFTPSAYQYNPRHSSAPTEIQKTARDLSDGTVAVPQTDDLVKMGKRDAWGKLLAYEVTVPILVDPHHALQACLHILLALVEYQLTQYSIQQQLQSSGNSWAVDDDDLQSTLVKLVPVLACSHVMLSPSIWQ